jgi:hypothetical protein
MSVEYNSAMTMKATDCHSSLSPRPAHCATSADTPHNCGFTYVDHHASCSASCQ